MKTPVQEAESQLKKATLKIGVADGLEGMLTRAGMCLRLQSSFHSWACILWMFAASVLNMPCNSVHLVRSNNLHDLRGANMVAASVSDVDPHAARLRTAKQDLQLAVDSNASDEKVQTLTGALSLAMNKFDEELKKAKNAIPKVPKPKGEKGKAKA